MLVGVVKMVVGVSFTACRERYSSGSGPSNESVGQVVGFKHPSK